MKFEWENIGPDMCRVKVFGGWIVRHWDTCLDDDGNAIATSLVFIPDANHEWEIDED